MKDGEDTLGQIALTFGTMKSSKVPIPPLPRGEGERRANGEGGQCKKRVVAGLKNSSDHIWAHSAQGEAFSEATSAPASSSHSRGLLVGWERAWGFHSGASERWAGRGSGDAGGRKKRISIARGVAIASQSFSGRISLSPSCFLGKIYESSQTEATDKAELFFFPAASSEKKLNPNG